MLVFTNWLTQALGNLSSTDLTYPERLMAFKRLHHAAFIANQKENYTYIPLREVLQQLTSQVYQVSTESSLSQTVSKDAVGFSYATDILTFINGVWSKRQSSFDDMREEIQLRRLADLPLMEQKEVVRGYMTDMELSDDLFATLNIMLSQETYVLEIADYTQLENIITIQHIVTEPAAHVVPQLLLKVGQASQLTIVESWYTAGNNVQHFINNLTHITLAEGATLAYYTLHVDYPSCYQVNTIYCHQKDHSIFTHYTFSFAAVMLRMNLTVQIKGDHATTTLYGLYGLSVKEKADYRIQVIHCCPHSLSKQHYKGILGGQAMAVFNGKIQLTPEAQKTNAYQTNNVIILSNDAHHYVKPQLEIYADDVKCSHGATAGQLDTTQLFYLQTRGIEESLAKRLLLEAFGREIISTVAVNALQDYLWDKFIAKLIRL